MMWQACPVSWSVDENKRTALSGTGQGKKAKGSVSQATPLFTSPKNYSVTATSYLGSTHRGSRLLWHRLLLL